MWTRINEREWVEEIGGSTKAVCVAGGDMFGGGSYSEYVKDGNGQATHRYEMNAYGTGSWFVWTECGDPLAAQRGKV